MEYSQLVNAVEAALSPRAAEQQGQVLIALTQAEARKMLQKDSGGRWKLILIWEGYGEHAEARRGMTVHRIATAIHQRESLLHKPNENHTKPRPSGQPPFSSLVELVTGWMVGMRFPDGTNADFAGFSLAGSDWVDSFPGTTAHVINWSLDAAIPPPPEEYLLTFPHLETSN